MILTVGVALTLFGFLAFIVGNLLDMQGMATIGGVIVFGVGLMASDGIQVKSGEKKVQVDNSTTRIKNTYRTVDMPQNLSFSLLVMLAGAGMTLRALGDTPT